jgi:hypothetical protein
MRAWGWSIRLRRGVENQTECHDEIGASIAETPWLETGASQKWEYAQSDSPDGLLRAEE